MGQGRLDGRYGGHRDILVGLVTALCVAACGGAGGGAKEPGAGAPAEDAGPPLPPPPRIEAFELPVKDALLKGELMVPVRDGKVPVVLIVAGSGPTDRDLNSIVGVRTDAYKLLAEDLVARGVASLRFDKRGVGRSTLEKAPSAITVKDFVADVEALVASLKSDPRFSSVVLLGHSEGALLSLLAQPKAQASALVLANAPGRPLAALLREQLKTKVDAKTLKAFDKAIVQLRKGEAKIDVPAPLAPLFAPAVRPFLRSIVDIDPVPLVAKTSAPVVVVDGDMDAQVSAVDGDRLAAARAGVTRTTVRGMNHVWKVEEKPTLPQESYTDPARPLAPGLAEAVAAAVQSATAAASTP